MVLAVGYRAKSKNAIVFRKWVSEILKDFLIKGYAIDADIAFRAFTKLLVPTAQKNKKGFPLGDSRTTTGESVIIKP